MRRPVFVLLLLATLAGCTEGPPPRVWAASVCSALTPWRDEITSLTSRAQEQTPQSTTPEQARENLVRMLDGAAQASEKARSKVAAAGVPEVDGGEVVAANMIVSLTRVRDAYTNARDEVQTIPAAEFYDGVGSAMVRLQHEYAASALDTSKLRSVELQRAFAEVPECH